MKSKSGRPTMKIRTFLFTITSALRGQKVMDNRGCFTMPLNTLSFIVEEGQKENTSCQKHFLGRSKTLSQDSKQSFMGSEFTQKDNI